MPAHPPDRVVPQPLTPEEELQKQNAVRTAREKLPVDQGNLPGSSVRKPEVQGAPDAGNHS